MNTKICAPVPFIQHTFPKDLLFVGHYMRWQEQKTRKVMLPGFWQLERKKISIAFSTEIEKNYPQLYMQQQNTPKQPNQTWERRTKLVASYFLISSYNTKLS